VIERESLDSGLCIDDYKVMVVSERRSSAVSEGSMGEPLWREGQRSVIVVGSRQRGSKGRESDYGHWEKEKKVHFDNPG